MVLLLVLVALGGVGGGRELARVVPVVVAAPQGEATGHLEVLLPTRGRTAISSPGELMEQVEASWGAVVAPHQAGLTDPKHSTALASTGLSSEEAWHHYQAAQAGVVDSARFLITFSMVPSVQTGGSRLHIAAALGHVATVRQLLEDGARVEAAKEDGTTALHSAATMGHAEVVGLLLEEGAWAEATGNSGATPLMMAASMGHLAAVQALLEGGAGPDTAHRYGKSTALHFAAEVGRVEVVRELCRRGADVEAEKVTGGTALHSAADANQTAVVQVLVEECGADANRLLMKDTTPLYLAAQRGFTGVVQVLLRLGATPNFVMPQGKTSTHMIPVSGEGSGGFYPVKNTEVGNGATALHAAVENGHLEAARALLEGGAVQSNSMEGATPLVIALQYRHPHIALLLLEDGRPDPHLDAQVPTDDSSALLVAVTSGYTEVVARLLERGADPNISTRRGVTPLAQAAARRQDTLVELLLRAGASVGSLHQAVAAGSPALVRQVLAAVPGAERAGVLAAREDGMTVLHLAVKARNKEVVELLLKEGAEVGAVVESTGATALHLAALQGGLEVVHLLLERGARLEARAGDSLYRAMPLYLAAQHGHSGVVEALVAAGADPNRRLWRMDATPLHAAADGGHRGAAAALLQLGASPHTRNWNGVTALGLAAMAGRVEVVKVLLAAGAQVNSRDKERSTLLVQVVASEAPSPPVVRALLEAGADPTLTNSRGEVVLVQAARVEGAPLLPLLRLLLQHTAVDGGQEVARDGLTFTLTALAVAASRGAVEGVRLLLEAGASYSSAVPEEGWRRGEPLLLPLGLAVRRGQAELVGLLLGVGAEQCWEGEGRGLGGCLQLAEEVGHPATTQAVSQAIANTSHKEHREL